MSRDRSLLTLGVLCGLLVLAAVAMIAVGLPEQTLLQQRLLQLYSVPLSGALALAVVHLAGRLPELSRPTKVVLGVSVGACVVGVAGMAVGLVAGLDALLPAGQAITWLGLGFALIWLVAQLPRRTDHRTFGLRPIDPEDDEKTAD
ncbi:MAG: hypothetical protein QM619_17010 [Micropruina sp.]|uniref:hypothetical protein n=1 Tax=Micropruina sp. TaxID=2737536 RepID=UPI0039E53194